MTSAVAAVVLLATLTVVWAAPPNPCFRAQMPNNDDPYSFYKCDAGGKAHLWRCAAGTMYDRRTQICDWEDQVRARNGQSGSGGARPSNGGNRDKIAVYVANLDWKSIAHTAAYAYKKVKPILDSVVECHYYDYNKGKDTGKNNNKDKGKDKGKGKEKPKYESSEESEEHYLPPSKDKGEGGREGREEGGRRPNRPANREPGPLDPDYDNGEDWGEMESWRDQFRESENMSPRERENAGGRNPPRNDRENGGGRNPARNDRENGGGGRAPRLDCSARADGPGNAPRMYPNPDDCATYFTCNMRRPVLTYCPRGLNYNPRRRGCDDSDPPNCRNVRGAQTPAEVFVYNRRLLPDVDPSNDVDDIESKPSSSSSEEEVVLPDRR